MAIVRISNNVYNVGVLNPFIRATSLDKQCPYGTSYNSYFIDDRKTVLIDLVDGLFAGDFMYNLGLVADIGAIDYIILNRVLPSYEKTIERILQSSPNTVIVCTKQGKNILDNILNTSYNCVIVENGDKLNLGRSLLEFVVTPMKFSPDAMCTYFENDSILFSGSLFGSDFCEPNVIDEDILYKELYNAEVEKYYNYYFRKYNQDINNILDTLTEKTFYKIAPLNGPVLSDMVEDIIEMYKSLSSWNDISNNSVVLYSSSTGYTKMLALTVEKIFLDKGLNCKLLNVSNTSVQECISAIENSQYIALGSCTINGDIPVDMWNVLAGLKSINTKGKNAFVFGSYGWSGEATEIIANRLKQCGITIKQEPFKVCMKPTKEDINAINITVNQMLG